MLFSTVSPGICIREIIPPAGFRLFFGCHFARQSFSPRGTIRRGGIQKPPLLAKFFLQENLWDSDDRVQTAKSMFARYLWVAWVTGFGQTLTTFFLGVPCAALVGGGIARRRLPS